MSDPLWTPEKTRAAQTTLGAFLSLDGIASRQALRRLRGACIATRRNHLPSSGRRCGTSRAWSATRARRPISSTATRCRARASFPSARLNFAENLLSTRRRRRRAGLLGRGQGEAAHELATSCASEVARAGASPARGRRGGRRPGRRDHAQHAGEHRRRARHRLDRRGVVVLLARFRRPGRPRPLRPDRAQGADRLRRLLLRRQDHRHLPTSWPRSSPSCRRCARSSSCPISAATTTCAQGLNASLIHKGARAQTWGDAVHARAAEPLRFERLPFAHPLYMLFSSGTTGMPKCIVHSAGGTLLKHLCEQQLHCRHQARRPRVLFHHARLDDVELAGLGLSRPARRCCSTTARRSIPTATSCGTTRRRRRRRCSAPRRNTSTP